MAETTDTARRTRTPLSRDRVLEVAVELADASGLDALTMRRLGQRLGVEAMSLYNHVEGKEDLLGAIVDLVFAEIILAPEVGGWKPSLRATALSAHDALLAHPWAPQLVLLPAPPRAFPRGRMAYMESILARLRAAGFSPAATSRGYHAIDSHVLGFTLWELGHRMPDDAALDDEVVERLIAELDLSSFPYLLEHAREHLREQAAPEVGEFEFGLDLVLDAFERWAGTERPGARGAPQA